MSASIKGHQSQLRITLNDGDSKIIDITGFDVSQDSNFSRSFYVGRQIGEGDQTIEGWSGSFSCEVKDASIDDLIDDIITNNLNGIGVSEIAILDTELYADGTSRSYVYFDNQFKMSKSVKGLNEKMTKGLDFQASGRIRI